MAALLIRPVIHWSAPTGGLRIACLFPQTVYRRHRRITATLLVENTGNKLVAIESRQPVHDYRAVLTGPDGRPAATTVAFANAQAFAASGSITRVFQTQLAPRDVFEDLYEVSHWFELPRTGEYRLSIELLQWRTKTRRLVTPRTPFAVVNALRP
jgi:hypothetical protein